MSQRIIQSRHRGRGGEAGVEQNITASHTIEKGQEDTIERIALLVILVKCSATMIRVNITGAKVLCVVTDTACSLRLMLLLAQHSNVSYALISTISSPGAES